MKTTYFILLLSGVLLNYTAAQTGSKNFVKRHSHAQVLDSTEGMLIYQRMMQVLRKDYELLQEQGSVVQGWNEEYYDNGELMHISYYKEGQLVLFKNFFENNQCQNHITYTDPQNCHIDVYFENGGLKNQLDFSESFPGKMTEFFANGLPKSQLEYSKEKKCVVFKRAWFMNAELQSELELINVEEQTYHEKLYYPNGQLKEEGDLLYSIENKAFIKTGVWITYESSGKKKSSEKFKFSLSSSQ